MVPGHKLTFLNRNVGMMNNYKKETLASLNFHIRQNPISAIKHTSSYNTEKLIIVNIYETEQIF